MDHKYPLYEHMILPEMRFLKGNAIAVANSGFWRS